MRDSKNSMAQGGRYAQVLRLETEAQTIQNESEILFRSLSACMKDCQASSETLNKLRERIQSNSEDNSHRARSVSKIGSELARAISDLSRLDKDNQRLQIQVGDAEQTRAQLKETKQRCYELEKEVTHLSVEAARLRETHAANAALSRDNRKLREQRDELTQQVSELERNQHSLGLKLENARQEVSNANHFRNRCEEMTAVIDDHSESIRALKKRLNEETAANHQRKEQIKRLHSERDGLIDEIKQLSHLKQLPSQVRRLQTQVSDKDRALEIAQRELEDVKDRLMDTSQKSKKISAEWERCRVRANELAHEKEQSSRALNKALSDYSQIKHELDECHSRMSEAQNQAESLRTRLHSSESELIRQRSEIEMLSECESELNQSVEKTGRLEKKCQRLNEGLIQNQERIKELELELIHRDRIHQNRHSQKVSQLEKKLNESRSLISELKERSEKWKSHSQRLLNEQSKNALLNEQLKRSLKDANRKVESMEADMDRCCSEKATELQNQQSQKIHADETIRRMKHEMQSLSQELETYRADFDAQSKELRRVKNELRGHLKKQHSLQSRNQSLSVKEAELEVVTAERDRLKQAFNACRRELAQIRADECETKRETSAVRGEVEDLRHELSALKAQSTAANQRVVYFEQVSHVAERERDEARALLQRKEELMHAAETDARLKGRSNHQKMVQMARQSQASKQAVRLSYLALSGARNSLQMLRSDIAKQSLINESLFHQQRSHLHSILENKS